MFNLPTDASVESLKEQVHPAVEAHGDRWALCLDAYDGEGGFLDGGYLWKFAREIDAEFKNRQSQARYHNYAATLIDYYTRKVFGREVQRTTANAELEAWWANVDGAGTDLTTYLRHALSKALAAGFVCVLADKTKDEATGPAKADEKSAVFLTRYLPTAVLDWRLAQDERLTAIKLSETVPTDDLLAEQAETDRVLLWDRDEWVRVSGDETTAVERANHGLQAVPVVALRPFRHARWPFIGRPLLGDGGVLRALYNRASEQDEVIRNQSFSVFVVGLPGTGEVDVEKAKAALGNEIGSLRALFTFGTGDYKTPSVEVPQTLEAHQAFLIRELYRMAHIPYERDSADAQSAEAIRLQHEELAAVLSGVASECERVEQELCKLYFAWTSASPELAARAYEAAKVRIAYKREYFEAEPEAELKTLSAAMQAVTSKTFGQVVQKAIVATVGRGLDPETVGKIHAEIEAGEPAEAPDVTHLRAGAEARLAALTRQAEPENDAEAAA